jgi:hypothetical protein
MNKRIGGRPNDLPASVWISIMASIDDSVGRSLCDDSFGLEKQEQWQSFEGAAISVRFQNVRLNFDAPANRRHSQAPAPATSLEWPRNGGPEGIGRVPGLTGRGHPCLQVGELRRRPQGQENFAQIAAGNVHGR